MNAYFSQNFSSRLLISIVLLGLYIQSIHDFLNFLTPHHLWLAAGNNAGESYIISKAIAKVVKEKSDLDIEVCTTDGTDENLDLLQQGKVQLATAQADYATETINKKNGMSNQKYFDSKTNNKKERCENQSLQRSTVGTPKLVAVLYQDYFHLFIKTGTSINNLNQLKNRLMNQVKITVDVPEKGGQLWSFQKVLEHYGINEKDIEKDKGYTNYFNLEDQDNSNAPVSNIKSCQELKADVVFRIRALGNQDIHKLVQLNCGKLIPIEEAAAMKLKHPAFNSDNIPTGTYQAAPPVPKEEQGLKTVAVSRLLLASDKSEGNAQNSIDNFIKNMIEIITQNPKEKNIKKITQIIVEERLKIVKAIDDPDVNPGCKEDNCEYIKPLIQGISRPPISPDIHPGALAFYNEDDNLWKKLNDNGNALNLFVALLAASPVGWALLLWWWQRPQKIEVDKYLNLANELIKNKRDVNLMQNELDSIFNQAVEALKINKISQESFRTFNEAYKATRETIERKRQVEQQTEAIKRKSEADEYINAVIKLINKDEGDVESRQKRLDEEFNKAALALIDTKISQSLFRTFNEAYKTTREAIEQERRLAHENQEQEQRRTAKSYISEVVEVLKEQRQGKYLLLEKLEKILQEVVTKLTEQKISEESFRTFMEAYKTTRDAIERRNS